MEYKYAAERPNYADLASGKVFYSLPGYPAFPVRLASEVYQRCLAFRGKGHTPCTVFDPCCGAAYHLSVVAYLHWDSVQRVICSDVDEKAVQLAERNLSLLTPEGMERRSQEISAMIRLFGKTSHQEALESLHRLQEQVVCLTDVRPMQSRVFRADATDATDIKQGLQDEAVDVVFTDIPYGKHTQWQETRAPNPVEAMLIALLGCLHAGSIVAVASGKAQKIEHAGYQRLDKFQVGKRQVVILKPA